MNRHACTHIRSAHKIFAGFARQLRNVVLATSSFHCLRTSQIGGAQRYSDKLAV